MFVAKQCLADIVPILLTSLIQDNFIVSRRTDVEMTTISMLFTAAQEQNPVLAGNLYINLFKSNVSFS